MDPHHSRYAFVDDSQLQPDAAPFAAPGLAPWPGQQPRAHQASGHAGAPFVQPGATQGQAPMGSQGGVIGTAPADDGAHGFVGHAQQQWAFATPNGYQLVQPGPDTMLVHAPIAHGPSMRATASPQPIRTTQPSAQALPTSSPTPPAPVAATKPARSRLRWETIVPIVAVCCLAGAAAVFAADFDRMTGRTGTATPAKAANGTPRVPSSTDGVDADAIVERATTMLAEGEFDQARELLSPYADRPNPDPAVTKLVRRLDTLIATNDRLLTQLTRRHTAKRWSSVLTTLGSLERLRPLSPSLVKIRTQARGMLRISTTTTKARALAKSGRITAALEVVDAAIKVGPSAQLTRLRSEIAAMRTSTPTTPIGGGPGHHAATPPRAQGSTPSMQGSTPPATGPAAGIPARPDIPNPTGGSGGVSSGQPAVSGGGDGHTDHTH